MNSTRTRYLDLATFPIAVAKELHTPSALRAFPRDHQFSPLGGCPVVLFRALLVGPGLTSQAQFMLRALSPAGLSPIHPHLRPIILAPPWPGRIFDFPTSHPPPTSAYHSKPTRPGPAFIKVLVPSSSSPLLFHSSSRYCQFSTRRIENNTVNMADVKLQTAAQEPSSMASTNEPNRNPKYDAKKPHITELPMTASNWYKHVNWLNVTLIIGVPVYGMIMSYWTPLHWKTGIFAFCYYFMTGLGITAGMFHHHSQIS